MNHSGSPGMAAVDVWNVLLSAITGAASIGKHMKDELFYAYHELGIDDLVGVVTSGTCTDHAKFIDNNTAAFAVFTIGETCEIEFQVPCYIKEYRQYGNANLIGDGRGKIEGWIGGAWVELAAAIATHTIAAWGPWTDLTLAAIVTTKIRYTCTTADTGGVGHRQPEWEFKGYPIG